MTNPVEIKGVTCSKCHWSDVFPAPICPRCYGPTTDTTFPGHGRIASFTIIRNPPLGFEKESPYAVALVDIQDGPRVMARVKTGQEELRIGQVVKLVSSSNGLLEFGA